MSKITLDELGEVLYNAQQKWFAENAPDERMGMRYDELRDDWRGEYRCMADALLEFIANDVHRRFRSIDIRFGAYEDRKP